jgi:hypothetical protein
MPQPVPWVSATTPSTPSSSATSSSVRRTIRRATVAEQFTVVSTPT